jgi:hypothetical protein
MASMYVRVKPPTLKFVARELSFWTACWMLTEISSAVGNCGRVVVSATVTLLYEPRK